MNNYVSQQLQSVTPGTRVLFANFPADGHFNPLTGLAVHLKEKGCDVRWYTSENYKEKIRKMGITFYGLKKAFDVSAHTDLESKFPERNKYRTQTGKLKFDMTHVFILRAPEYYQDILEIYQEFKFDIMIADITFGGIPFVKDNMKIPVIGVGVVPLPETSRDLPPSGLGLTPSYSRIGKLKQRLLRYLTDRLIFAQPSGLMRKILADHGIDAGNSGIFDIMIQKSTVVLQSGTPGFEYKRSDLSNHIHFAGPLLPFQHKTNHKKWALQKSGTYEHVILVTQGTVEKDVEKLIVPTLEAFKDSGYLVIVTTGGQQTRELRLRYPQDNFIIEDYIPFHDVMPLADVYISNGGYGGVLLSIQNNLPMVVAGVHEGKNEINARVGYFKLGINLHTEKPTALQLKKAVDNILANPEYTANVKKLNKEFSKYQPELICEDQVARLVKPAVYQKLKRETAETYIY